MIPVSLLAVASASAVVSGRAKTHDAAVAGMRVSELDALVDIHSAMSEQRSAAEFRVRFQELGVSVETASVSIGFDVAAIERGARATASAALKVLGSGSPVSAEELSVMYTAVDAGTLTPQRQVQAFRGYATAAQNAFNSRLRLLEQSVRGLSGDKLLTGLESLRAADDLTDVSARQGIDLSILWFAAPGASQQSRDVVLVRLGTELGDYTSAEQRIHDLGVPAVVRALTLIHEDPRVRPFEGALEAARAGLRPDIATTTAVFGGYLTRGRLLNDLVSTTATGVTREARALELSEHRAFVMQGALSTVFSLLLIAIAIAFARSIARPLRALGAYAHGVNEGRLDEDPGSARRRGPRETRLAFSAFEDLVATLKLLDAKATALAACRFTDPVLKAPLPGRLGESLESSVALLSASIVERQQLQTHLAHQATHDPLTGIANRAGALAAIQTSLHRAGRSGNAVALLFLDLNDFKSVNDRYGHEGGDRVLRAVAERISGCLRPGDLVARLGGDEFVVLAEQVGGIGHATDLARRLLAAVEEPIEFGAFSIEVGVAVGIAMAMDGPEEPLQLLARADAAMYRAKSHDRSAVEIFDVDMQQRMLEREDIERALASALADPTGGGLRLDFQPVINASSGALDGVEALVRWDRPEHGLLAPDAFIPIAEQTSLIVDLDRWVLNQVGRQLGAWSTDSELAAIPIAVNISGRHLLSGQLVRHLLQMLQTTKALPHLLTIEITETVLVDDLVAAGVELDAVRALGIRVAIDDFGTGYTSIAHLQHLPIDVIKIDRSFTRQLDQKRGRSLVRMLTELGHANDLGIIAEGVETEGELTALQAMGADQIQGYLLCRPLDAQSLSTWVRGRRPRPVSLVPAPRAAITPKPGVWMPPASN
ncbi:MAG: hypothetical protein QOE64_1357 [Frankiales bacterium]|jgi:diguanylate cyclase (GGDEF)-like protein|nr:hypothetical protein [Frankiales bacterium]